MGVTGLNPGSAGAGAPRDADEQMRRLRDIERKLEQMFADGTLRALIDSLPASVLANVVTILAAGISTASLSVSGGATLAGGVNSVPVYNTSLTYGGLYKVQYVHQDGTMGYVSSSRRYKQDEEPAVIPNIREIMRAFQIFTFRYIEAVANIGDAAAVEWGPMAEDVHAAGLGWLVEYDEQGRPEGVRHERFAYLAILYAQDLQSQLDALTDRLDAAAL